MRRQHRLGFLWFGWFGTITALGHVACSEADDFGSAEEHSTELAAQALATSLEETSTELAAQATAASPEETSTEIGEQALTGSLSIRGRVTSPQGEPISGVKVSLTGPATRSANIRALTDANGEYAFTNLLAGSYTVSPTKPGFTFCGGRSSLPNLRRDTTEDFTGSTSGCDTPVHQRKVEVLVFDPEVTKNSISGTRLSNYMKWDDPLQLANQFRRAIESMTNGRVRYKIAKTRIVDDIPRKADGFDYSMDHYLKCIAETSTCHEPDAVDMRAIVDSYEICSDTNAEAIDEVWMFGGPYFGFYESQLIGPNGFWYNSPPLEGTNCRKLVPVMGFNYERKLEEMVHDVMHRTEATMARVYGSWEENRMNHAWDRFALVAAQSPSYGISGCGNGHYAPNSTDDYQYDSTAPVESYCDDFFHYPNMGAPPSVLKTITCAAWGCSELGYYRYFFQHLPKAAGLGPDGRFADWWRYLVKPNDVSLTDPVSCSSEYAGGWCQAVLDGAHGSCNVGEWATAGVPTGWAKITLPLPRSVGAVSLYDRACPEQVLAGHLEFSDGSASLRFGALEDSGATPTRITFAPKTLSWIKVVIDQSTGVNPGLGEVVIH